MKLNKIKWAFVLAAVLSTAACSDDEDYTIPNVDAPALVKTTPVEGASKVRWGNISVTVEYDKNVFFATEDLHKISVSGATLVSADVIGSSNVLTLVVNCPTRDTQVSVSIPEGVVTGAQGKPAPAVDFSFSTMAVDKTPVAATSTAARNLYNFLVENMEKKIISGMMAKEAWNIDASEQVYGWTGKYPAINGFDYLFMAASEKGLNWAPNYRDITPVKDWADNGGIVTMTWHWNVPRTAITLPDSGEPVAQAEDNMLTIDEQEKYLPEDWSGYLQLTAETHKAVLAEASVGDELIVKIKDVAANAQGSIKNAAWTGFVDESGKSWEYFDISGDQYVMVLDATTLAEMQANGCIIGGHDYTVTGVYLKIAGAPAEPIAALDPAKDFAFYTADTQFDAANALIEGTWENYVWKHDIAIMTEYLKLLRDADIPVLWRPFHEAAGGWFWWGKDADSFKKMWIAMFEEFKKAGLDNLIWIWTAETGDDAWYPGDAYVDVIGRDLYGNTDADCAANYSALTATYGNKIIALSECGYSSYTDTVIATITEQWNAGAKWSWFMPWYDGGDAENSHAPAAWWKDAMNNANVITRDQVPNLK